MLRRFDAVDSAADVLDLQLALVDEIKTAEHAISLDRSSPEHLHRHLTRRIGDAIAWFCLHPYSIRQLYLGAAAPPNISRQDGFSVTLEAAEAVTSRGIPALISDVTYCLGTGDVVVADDPERPSIIECGNPHFATTRRKQRQEQRANAALAQLRDGVARWPGRPLPTITKEVSSEQEHVFDAVADAVESASKDLSAVRRVDDRQIVFALSADCEVEDLAQVGELGDQLDMPAFVISSAHDRRPTPRLAPPYIWPISAECRTLVSEADVLVGQVVDLAALDGRSLGDARLLEVQRRRDAVFITAERGQTAFLITPDPIFEALGNFESLDSMASTLLGGLSDVAGEPDGPGPGASDTVPAEWGIPDDLVDALRERAERLGHE